MNNDEGRGHSAPAPNNITASHDTHWMRSRLEELALDVGRLRRTARDTRLGHRVDAICDRVWWLVAAFQPTAADLFRESGDLKASLDTADRETRRLERLLQADLRPQRPHALDLQPRAKGRR